MSGVGNAWTAERVELLEKLWAQGLSASRIAVELGDGISRNAVIGKVHRLGLGGRATSSAPKERRRLLGRNSGLSVKKIARSTGSTAFALAPDAQIDPASERATPEALILPISPRLTLVELQPSSCRWPLGDPTSTEFRFCGAPAVQGLPYCRYHAAVAYQAADPRTARRSAMPRR